MQDNFFRQKEIKALRRQPNGNVMTIIYLEMQLASLQNGGVLLFEGFEDSFVEELAYQLEEEPEEVGKTVEFLKKHDLLLELSPTENQLPKVLECIGSEGSSAQRVRKFREKESALQCNTNSLQCNANTSKCNAESLHCYGDIETEQEKETHIETEGEKEKEEERECGREEEERKENKSKPGTIERVFDILWNHYPKKSDKEAAFEEIKTLPLIKDGSVDNEFLGKITSRLINDIKSSQWQEENGRYIPKFVNWLKNKPWENELPPKSRPYEGYKRFT